MAAQISSIGVPAGGDCRRGCGPHCCSLVVTLTCAAVLVLGIPQGDFSDRNQIDTIAPMDGAVLIAAFFVRSSPLGADVAIGRAGDLRGPCRHPRRHRALHAGERCRHD